MRWSAILCALFVLGSECLAGFDFDRQVLAALEYGPGPGQALVVLEQGGSGAPEGITDFWVEEDRTVWIAESVLGRIQRFDSRGELVWVTNNVDCLNGIAVDDDGLLYAMGGCGRGDITILNQSGEKIWETRRWDERTEMMRATMDSIIHAASDRFAHGERRIRGPRIAEGKRIRDKHGKEYRVQETRNEGGRWRISIEVIGETEAECAELDLPAAFYVAVDDEGRIWATEVVDRAEGKPITDRVGGYLVPWVSRSELKTTVYDNRGNGLAMLVVDKPPRIIGGANLEVKRDGSVVLLEYFPEHVEVVRYVLEEGESAKGPGEDDTAAAAVETQLRSRDPAVRRTGVGVLVSKGEAGLEEVVGMLRTSDKMVQGGAAEALGRIGDKRAVEPLLEVVQSPERFVRRRVVEALGEIGEARAVGALTARLSDEDWFTRYKAAQALGKTGDSRAIAALLEALEDDNRYVREEAGAALRSMCGVEQLDALADAMGHQDFLVRTEATSVLKSITERTRDMRTLGLLVRAISDAAFGNPEIAATAVGYLGEAAADTLLPLLGARYAHVRVQAAAALGEIRCMRAVEPLLRLLDMKEPTIRLASIRALGQIGDARAIDRLAELVVARDEYSWDAARSLGMIGLPALKVLLEFVGSDDFFVRHDAVSGLAKIDDARAREALRKASNDPHPLVQETARRILLGLDGVE